MTKVIYESKVYSIWWNTWNTSPKLIGKYLRWQDAMAIVDMKS